MILPSLLLALAGCAVQAQVFVGAGPVDRVAQAGEGLRRSLSPPKADPEVLDALVRRLMRDGEQEETPLGPALSFSGVSADQAKAELKVLLFGGMLPPREIGEPGSGYIDLALRYSFSHFEGTSSTRKTLGDGSLQVDTWSYVVAMDGTIVSVLKLITVVSTGDKEGPRIDEKRSRELKMDPRDPSVVRRWKNLERKFLRLGPTVEI